MSYYGSCKGTTKNGQPCRSVDIYENGLCAHHGGAGNLVRVEMLKARLLKKTNRLLAKQRKFDRMVAKAMKADPKLAEMIETARAARKRKDNPLPSIP